MDSGMIQAFANVVDAAVNVWNVIVWNLIIALWKLAITIVTAPRTLKNSYSCLEAKMNSLHAIRSSVQAKFEIYWFKKEKFDLWLPDLDIIEHQVHKLKEKFSKLEHASFLYVASRLALTEDINAKCTEIDTVLAKGKELEDALVKTDSRRFVELEIPISIENISSFTKTMKELLDCLQDARINTIRLHSDAGGGEGVVIQHLNNHKVVHCMFDIILWIPTSDFPLRGQESSVEHGIQRLVAKRLGLCTEGMNNENVAYAIGDQLKGAKYLLLLDDVKVSNIKLQTIGIPKNTAGSKIVYTTNFPVFPFSEKLSDPQLRNMKMKKLEIEDAWNLFEDIFGDKKDIISENDIEPIAINVVKWCDGIFLVIKTVATYFKSTTDQRSWSKGLEMLRKAPMKGEIYMQAMENFWKFSYGSLEDYQKICFLFCALYPKYNKIPIDCLFDCWAVLQKDIQVYNILGRLLDCALINTSEDKLYVTIDKVFREAALKILEKHDQFKCVVEEEALKKLKNNDCKDTNWFSLTNSEIETLPDGIVCPKLTTLFLQKNSKLKCIPSSFFKQLYDLQILDLYKTRSELVLPMSDMQKLKVVYLNDCPMLKEFPLKIEKEKEKEKEGDAHPLEVLDMRGYVINEISKDIKIFKHLRRLMVSIDRGINCGTLGDLKICELSSLNELVIEVKSDVVHNDENSKISWCDKVIGDIIEKIDTSENLRALKVHFKNEIVDVIKVVDDDTVRIFVPDSGRLEHIWKRSRNRDKAQVFIGIRMTSTSKISSFFGKHYDSFVLSYDLISIDHKEVLDKVKALIMWKDNSLEHLDWMKDHNLDHIEGCLVHRCDKIETLTKTHGFLNLQTLVLSECCQLKVLFSNNVVLDINRLEIRDCPAIEEINMLSASGDDILPKLTTLVLHNLPKLNKICSDMIWPSMSTLQIHECPNLKELPLNMNSAKNLLVINVEKAWWWNLKLNRLIKGKFAEFLKFS